MSEEKLQQLGIIEQSLNQALTQKQQYDKLLLDTTAALEEIGDSKEVYQIVGSIMIKKDVSDVKKDLEEKKERYNVRVKSLEKQEKQLLMLLQTFQKAFPVSRFQNHLAVKRRIYKNSEISIKKIVKQTYKQQQFLLQHSHSLISYQD